MSRALTISDLVAAARARLGQTYLPGGAQEAGMNCLGLWVNVLRDAAPDHPLIAAAMPYVDRRKSDGPLGMVRALRRHMLPVKVHEARIGDLLVFRSGRGIPEHLAMLVEPGMVIHADARRGRVVEHRLTAEARPSHAFRFPDLA